MKLLVHMGLHKTGSTYLQYLLGTNHATLAQAGFWYPPQEGDPAHHDAARCFQFGDGTPLAEMIMAARHAGCHTLILSTENLECALYDHIASRTIAETARDCGITDVEWHVVLRRPGEVFPSLFAQVKHNIYADATQMFYDAMRKGSIHIDNPMTLDRTPFWYFCIDQAADLDRFARHLCHVGAHELIAHDYADATPFPGWAMLPEEARAALTAAPPPWARNARSTENDVAQGYVERMFAVVSDADDQERIMDAFLASLRASLASVQTYAALVEERFIASHRDALARYGRRAPG